MGKEVFTGLADAIYSKKSLNFATPGAPSRNGLENDDKYRMVEDELISIARKFTVHLHAAEYHRLKQQAKARNAEAIDSISRPVVGRMSLAVQARNDRLERARKRRDGLKAALAKGKGKGLEVESDDDGALMGTSLQGLMEAPKKSAVKLSRLTSVAPSTRDITRLESGEARSSRRTHLTRPPVRVVDNTMEESSDPDDLDVPVRRATLPPLPAPRRTPLESCHDAVNPGLPAVKHPRQSTWPSISHPSREKRPAVTRQEIKEERETTSIILSDSDEDLFAGLKKKRRETRRTIPQARPRATGASSASAKSEGTSKTAPTDIIPSFLF
ncbi:hypothetical protein SAPIO_CDS9762 [Scedosporium apiospermum]|uniref:Uncharacterized protein n=1 Tax=Pseudallescheria apiosperma TaxID=563466 RepID=A0A084FXH5_PSEDA|nr:uncharacterized protein SAPIO_CDS9762 [Scedosporium apiospermum]KEZ39787.1 hypothetical protein SAPIO_CDS9762 [Scedosporium apiospermum]